MKTSYSHLALILLALMPAGIALGDTVAPVYVAEDGVDSGDCLDANNPCRSIGYAIGRLGKGSEIKVASGTYAVERPQEIFDLVSGAVKISGGGRFGTRRSQDYGETVLRGIPFSYREQFEGLGIRIVADQKGMDDEVLAAADDMLTRHNSAKQSMAAAPCVGGTADGFPCDNVDLLSHLGFADISATPTAGNDIWGFVDLNTGREYALMGFSIGTGVFDVTDPTTPREVGFIDGQSEIWRDIKVYQFFDAAADRYRAYAYVTTDGSTTDGLVVIDMTGLPHSIQRVNFPSDFLSAHNVYATNTDYSTGLSLTGAAPTLIIAGSNIGNGRYRQYSLASPTMPSFITGGTGTGYMHDASSIIITDSRKDTQCVNATATYCEVVLDFNENMIEIWDVTNAATPVQLSATPYANTGYVHSGWWSEDKQSIFVHDELDEQGFGLPTTVRVFSVADLRAPSLLTTWSGPTGAIDHNGFVRGNRYYMSNYRRGLTVLDITDPANPAESGWFDTFPAADNALFNGAWGAYPYFYSGNVAVSDIDSGLYMVEDRTRDVAEGSLAFTSASFSATEGQAAQVVVSRSGGSTGAVSVNYEVVNASASDADYSVASGTLSWGGGNSGNRTINVNAVSDGLGEGMERLLVRLINPAGGATLGNLSTASVYLSDPGAASEVRFADSAASVAERGFATIVAVVRRTGSANGAASVDYSLTAGDATAGTDFTGSTTGTLNWADGDGDAKTLEFRIVDDGVVEPDETFRIALSNPSGATIAGSPDFDAIIRDAAGSNTAPNAIVGASQVRSSGSQVTLDGSQSSDPDGDILGFQWSQTSGPTVSLTNANTATASFTAPSVQSDTLLQFRLDVTDPSGLSDFAVTTITVTTTTVQPQPSGGGGGGPVGVLTLLMLGALSLRRSVSRRDAA